MMDEIRRLADCLPDDKQISAQDVKKLIYAACGYAEALYALRHLWDDMQDTQVIGYKDTENE